MNRLSRTLGAALAAVLVTLGLAAPSAAQTAQLQVIHNAPDPAAAEVDIYVNGDRLLDDFAFRSATPFVEVPAGVELTVAVAPPTSTSADEALATFPVTLESGGHYLAVATGLLDPSGFDLPEGRMAGFTLVLEDARMHAGRQGTVSLLAMHGVPDAPTVDIVRAEGSTLVDDLDYGEAAGYIDVPPAVYSISLTPADADTRLVTAYANLKPLEGGAAVVLASGFINSDAMGAPGFALLAVLPDGTVMRLPIIASAL